MTGGIVLDSSAILAHLLQEPGAEAVLEAIEDADRMVHVSSVNLCEVSSKLVVIGVSASLVAMNMQPFLKYVVSFDAQQALFAGEVARLTRPFGLSLGDRACLALASTRGATAWTTDTDWKRLKVGVKVRLLRG
jgi:ribonuclease VapC